MSLAAAMESHHHLQHLQHLKLLFVTFRRTKKCQSIIERILQLYYFLFQSVKLCFS